MPAGKMCVPVSSLLCLVQGHRNVVQEYFNTSSAGGLLSGSLGLLFSKSEVTVQVSHTKPGVWWGLFRLNYTTPAFGDSRILKPAINLLLSN